MLSLWKWMPPRMRLYPAQPSNHRSARSPIHLVTQLTLSMALQLVWGHTAEGDCCIKHLHNQQGLRSVPSCPDHV